MKGAGIWTGVVAAAAIAVYAVSLGGAFVHDDLKTVRDHPVVQGKLPLSGLLTHDVIGHPFERGGYAFRPWVTFSYRAARSLSEGPAVHHGVNVALHALMCVLVFWAGRRALGNDSTAGCAALLFAAHPIHAEAVANVTGQSELWATAGLLGAWLAWARFRDTGRIAWLAAGLAAAAIGALSKEVALLIPVLLALDAWRLRADSPAGDEGARRRRALLGLGAFAVLAVALLTVRRAVTGIWGVGAVTALDNPLVGHPAAVRVLNAFRILGFDLWLLLWPARLSPDYGLDAIPVATSPFEPHVLFFLALLAAWLGLLAWGARRDRRLALAAALFLAAALPGSNLFGTVGTMLAERTLYLPSLGFVWVAVRLGEAAFRPLAEPRRARVLAAAAAALAAVYGVRAFSRSLEWRDPRSLWTAAVEVVPRSAKTHYNLALVAESGGDRAEALRQIGIAVSLVPDYVEAYALGAVLLQREGKSGRALDELNRALLLAPGYRDAYVARAALLAAHGKADAALRDYDAALSAGPHFASYQNRALIRAAKGDDAGALADLEAAAALEPGRPEPHLARAQIRARLKEWNAAVADLDAALERVGPNPDDRARVLFEKGAVLVDAGLATRAQETLEEAVALGYPLAHFELARLHEGMGNIVAAVRHYGMGAEAVPELRAWAGKQIDRLTLGR